MGLWLKVDSVNKTYDKCEHYSDDKVNAFRTKQEITIGSSTFSGHLNKNDQLILIDDEHYDYAAMVVRNEEYNNYKTKYEELEKKYNDLKKKKGKTIQFITVEELIGDLTKPLPIIFKKIVKESDVITGYENICECQSDSDGIKPYLKSIVSEWSVCTLLNVKKHLIIVIEEDDGMVLIASDHEEIIED